MIKHKIIFISILIQLAIVNVCSQHSNCDNKSIKRYIHIAHTRTDSNPKMDTNIEKINYKEYDMTWLGGDMAISTSLNDNTMNYVDSILNISSDSTLWAIGNHDYYDLDRFQSYTKRPLYYATHQNGITFIILDTKDDNCSITGQQKELFDNVIDTIQNSSHLVILHHLLFWMVNNENLHGQIRSVSNGPYRDKITGCGCCLFPNNFYDDIYPRLVETKEKGINVVCIGGDIGFRTKKFEYVTPEGIYFLASGVESGCSTNKALVFTHNTESRELSWEFKLTSELLPIDQTPPEPSM